jgi:hypothetical protein
MKKAIYIIAFIITGHAQAQKWEIGVSAGAANYWGDLAPRCCIQNETKPAGALFARHDISTSLRCGE